MNTQIIKGFPNYNSPGFSMDEYRDIYRYNNVIVHAFSSQVFYDEHWGTLTIKSAFGGDENYISSGCRYRVQDRSFLVINDGASYSSYIDSPGSVESLALFFNRPTVLEMYHFLGSNDQGLLDNPFFYKNYTGEFELFTNSSPIIIEQIVSIRKLLNTDKLCRENLDLIMRSILENTIKLKLEEKKFVSGISSQTSGTIEELYKRLGRAKDYMHSNYNENVTINELAKIACLCPNHMIRRFKDLFKTTPHQYLTKIRLENSKVLLAESKLSISEICNNVGFISLGTFLNSF